MSQNKYITNTYNKGLYLDALGNSQPDGTYSYALNAVNMDFDQLGEFSNENSNRLSTEFDDQVKGWGYIDERDKFLVFTTKGLYLLDPHTAEKEFIASDEEFSCDWNLDSCEWISPQFKTIDPCKETIVYWSSGCEYFKVNIDEMLNETRKNALKDSMKPEWNQCSDITCEYFKVFKLSCPPKITPIAYNKGGGSLLAGAYQYSVRLLTNEGAPTNWFTISDPVYVGGDHNEAGEITNGVIEIGLTNLDCNFDYGELAVISTIGGRPTAKLLTRFNYTNGNFTYTHVGSDEGDSIAIDEIITRGKTYLQGKDLIQYNGNMIYWNIRQTKNLNYQRKVMEQVKTNWIKYRLPYKIASKYNIKSYMRGETYGFGVKYNSSDGRSTRVFHICPQSGGGDGGSSSSAIPDPGDPIATIGTIGITQDGEYKRDRTPKPDYVRNPDLTQQDDDTKSAIEGLSTDTSHVCTGLLDCEECAIASTQCNEDSPELNELMGTIGGVIGIGNDDVDDMEVDYGLTDFKQTADYLTGKVKNRERQEFIARKITVNKGTQVDLTGAEKISDTRSFSGQYFNSDGEAEIEFDFKRTNLGRSIVSEEQDILYPDIKDCEGEYIYLYANEPVRHHQVPWTSEVPHYISNSIGVPSRATPDADEYSDAYVDIIGVQFTDIPIPTEEELGFKLCKNNPYTILQIPRTSKNKTIHSKGIVTSQILSTNDGRDFLYPAHGLNSEDSIVNRYINKDGSRLDPDAQLLDHYNYWSLDTMTKAHALNVSEIKVEGIVSGIGNRHGLYELGEEPADSKYGSRIDQRGTRQAINLNKFSGESKSESIDYKIYAPANEVVSPPSGAPCALMNKYQQESVWLGAPLGPLTDASFKGDVLDHEAPITDAKAYYVALIRNLPNQYGDLTNMPYFPILESTSFTSASIEGMCGDTFIGPHSFVRTSYVSDKVGDLFPIGNMVNGKADRCVCDSPEEGIHSQVGAYNPFELPRDGDKADPKNWAGLHTSSISKRSKEVQGQRPISHYYYPKTLTTMITYWGEFEVNPYMRQRGDLLREQVYNYIKPDFGLDSSINSNSGNGWDKDYLNQFYWEVVQPSKWKITQKTLIRSLLLLLAPMIGLSTTFITQTPQEWLTGLATTGVFSSIWFVALKILFNNKKLEELFSIGDCKMDSEGGEKDNFITNFFQNFTKYNKDFTIQNKIEVHYGLPVPYYTCDCDDCSLKTTDEVYISDEQKQNSQIDAYSIVRPKNFFNVKASYGDLVDIFIENGGLYAHTTDQWIPLQYARTLIPTNNSDIILGQGPLLGGGMGPAEGTSEGFGGILSKQHAINTQYGRVFLDYKARKLYLFRGGQIKELSDLGVHTHFRNKLPYCSAPGSCDNEHLDGNDIALGLDPRLERILITKREESLDNSWTLSYSIKNQSWVSFHSYIPRFYVWDRKQLITSDGTNFYTHDVRTNFQTFMGKYYPHIIRFKITDRDFLHEQFKGGLLDTYAVKSLDEYHLNLLGREVTFNKLWVQNDHQTTGIVELFPITTKNGEKENMDNRTSENPHVNLTRDRGHWSYNGLMDLTQDYSLPLYTGSPCSMDIVPANLLPYSDSTAFTNNIHLNNYLSITFILDNFDEYKLYTRSHTLHNKKDPEFLQ